MVGERERGVRQLRYVHYSDSGQLGMWVYL